MFSTFDGQSEDAVVVDHVGHRGELFSAAAEHVPARLAVKLDPQVHKATSRLQSKRVFMSRHIK